MGNLTKLVPDNQLILDAPLLKVPLELIRRNFKSAQRTIDKETKAITASLNEATQRAQLGAASADETIASIDLKIKRMQTLKRKACHPLPNLSIIVLISGYSSQIFKLRKNFGCIDPKFVLDTPPICLNVIHLKIPTLRNGASKDSIDSWSTTCFGKA
jgi:hypothetical protein